jgi:hypothetical protein
MNNTWLLLNKLHLVPCIITYDLLKSRDALLRVKYKMDECIKQIPIAHAAHIYAPGRAGYDEAKTHFDSIIVM